MIRNRAVLGLIPARGGSKRAPKKNLRRVGGRPLIAWTIEEARKSRYIDRLILSSEDDEIIAVAKEWGCEVPFKRPPELATDEARGIEPVLHALHVVQGFDLIVLLQPTSPLRIVDDIDQCIEKCVYDEGAPCVVSVAQVDKNPGWMYTLERADKLRPLLKGTDSSTPYALDPVYALNGAVYVAEVNWLKKSKSFLTDETVGMIMPKERSLDIDTELDFRILNAIIPSNEQV
ncbi:MAG: acylneuraminate cytidylyltransferase family protein [Nitrospira sp. BO4]|jgi:N-acylneuraminate cytidylyltransferase|nr:acylneuraminate cytidylyltransferase family protein [Nitrospira sp. BO4]